MMTKKETTELELQRLLDWLQDKNREPAQTKFTEGMTRNVAKEIEYLLKYHDQRQLLTDFAIYMAKNMKQGDTPAWLIEQFIENY